MAKKIKKEEEEATSNKSSNSDSSDVSWRELNKNILDVAITAQQKWILEIMDLGDQSFEFFNTIIHLCIVNNSDKLIDYIESEYFANSMSKELHDSLLQTLKTHLNMKKGR